MTISAPYCEENPFQIVLKGRGMEISYMLGLGLSRTHSVMLYFGPTCLTSFVQIVKWLHDQVFHDPRPWTGPALKQETLALWA